MNYRKSWILTLLIAFLSFTGNTKAQVQTQEAKAKDGLKYHIIQSGETLYRITQTYQLTAEEICKANPGLSAQNFRAGETILIPIAQTNVTPILPPKSNPNPKGIAGSDCREMHKVKRKETIFSIAKKYNLSIEQLINANAEMKEKGYELKKGAFICIPIAVVIPPPPSDAELFSVAQAKTKPISHLRIAVLLPFKSKTAEGARTVEYYQGILMAVDSIRRLGTSVELYAYHSGTTESDMNLILSNPKMKQMNLIFGPLYRTQMPTLNNFSKTNRIIVVSPFSSKGEEVYNNPQWMMLNSPDHEERAEVYHRFLSTFGKSNVVFIHKFPQGSEFTRGLQMKLKEQAITYSSLTQQFTDSQLRECLSSTTTNMIIPSSEEISALNVIAPKLKDFIKANPSYRLQLFGYPDWQTFVRSQLENFYALDTYIYTPFYRNPLSVNVARFERDYYKHFHKNMTKSYPRMAMFGFDSALFFMKGVSRYGTSFSNQEIFSAPYQNGIKLKRVTNWGGMINNNIWFVHYNTTHKIEINTFK
ncbi:MAG: LysM domain-containing protein [Bacteroidaceae bacterium]